MKGRTVCFFLVIGLLFFLGGCETLRDSPKYGFTEGYYYSRLHQKKVKKIYIVPGDDSIKVYTPKRLARYIDTTRSLKIAFPAKTRPDSFPNYIFKKSSLDFDVLNLLFKFRPAVRDFPPQFNNNILNAAFYVGKRTDLFHLKYKESPLGVEERQVTHYGYSFGLFTGFGASRIDEYVTRNALTIEYDGVVNILGAAAVLAMDKINFGLNVGVDHLLDRNKPLWIYQAKPWVGLSIGLNLN